jgi:flagellar biosynthesis/type III secretory pathway M-ring protein FliF/YscJ
MSALAVLAAVTPSPEQTVDPDLVTPGPWGFVTILVLVVAVFLLVFDMLRRVRRARYREEANEVLDAEEAAAREAADRGTTERRAADAAGRTDDEPGASGPTPGR